MILIITQSFPQVSALLLS